MLNANRPPINPFAIGDDVIFKNLASAARADGACVVSSHVGESSIAAATFVSIRASAALADGATVVSAHVGASLIDALASAAVHAEPL